MAFYLFTGQRGKGLQFGHITIKILISLSNSNLNRWLDVQVWTSGDRSGLKMAMFVLYKVFKAMKLNEITYSWEEVLYLLPGAHHNIEMSQR